MKVDTAVLERLRLLHSHRDDLARMLGMAEIEHVLARRKFVEEFNGEELRLRIGAAQIELEKVRLHVMRRIDASGEQEKQIAEGALRVMLTEPVFDGATWTVDLKDGEVMRLVRGAWVPAGGEIRAN